LGRPETAACDGGGQETSMNGAEACLECLRREGVEYVFGYPGGAVIPLMMR